MRLKAIACWVMPLLLVPLSPAGAGGASTSSDPRGDVSSRLDIVHISASRVTRGVELKIVTANARPCEYIEYEPSVGNASKARLYWEVDGDGDGDVDVTGHYYCDNGERAVKFELYTSEREDRDTLAARRPNRRTVISLLKPHRFDELRGNQLWLRAVSTTDGYDGRPHIMISETDRAPDRGQLHIDR